MPVSSVCAGRRLLWTLATTAALAGNADPLIGAGPAADPGQLVCRPLPAAPEVKPLDVGQTVRTGLRERRRLLLPDGSAVLVNQNSAVELTAADRLTVTAGEVLVDGAGRTQKSLHVATPKRDLSALGARFAVGVADAGTAVVVTRGSVAVEGTAVVTAGQQLRPADTVPAPAGDAAARLRWASDLMEPADAALVPASPYAGGSLVAVDPDGQEAKLSLRKVHIDVYVEDGFARTTIDQTYFNHTPQRLEGTFYFPLPPDASLSRLAMYVDGNLMEGGMVDRDYGRDVYETVVYRKKDPALLEWVDGSTFKMRVFPLEARQEKRLVLSYIQKLPSSDGRLSYRFPAAAAQPSSGAGAVPGGGAGDWSFHARVKGGAAFSWNSASHPLKSSTDGADLVLDESEKNGKLDRDVRLEVTNAGAAPDSARFASAVQDGARYVTARWLPDLPGKGERRRRDWVFLFESSGDRDPLLARAQVEVVRGLLANAGPQETVTVLTAGARTVAQEDAVGRAASESTRDDVISGLETAHLVGALDLEKALAAAGPRLKELQNPYLVHVGGGFPALGERRTDQLLKYLPPGTIYVGVGVGRRWNRAFMKAAAERTGGVFTQINPDDNIPWRTLELASALDAPRLLDITVTDRAGGLSFLTTADAVARGEELCAVARLPADAPTPEAVVVRGLLDGKPFERELPVKEMSAQADYLPRLWARLEIDRLLTEDAVKHKDEIVDLSKAMYVVTPFTSLLVLENEEMYQQYKVERGRKDHWAMYPCPDKIPVVAEDEDGRPIDPTKQAKPSAREVLKTVAARDVPAVLGSPYTGAAQELQMAIKTGGKVFFTEEALNNVAASLPPLPSPLAIDAEAERNVKGRELGIYKPLPTGGVAGLDYALFLRVNVGPGRPTVDPQLERRLRDRNLGYRPSLLSGIFVPSAKMQEQAAAPTVNAFRNIPAPSADRVLGTVMLGRQPVLVGGILSPGEDGPLVFGVDSDGRANRQSPPASAGEYRRMIESDEDADGLRGFPFAAGSLLYARPNFSGDERLFYDLTAYAPGLNTGAADVYAVLDAEAAPGPDAKTGDVDPGARALIDKARGAGWQSLTYPADGERPAWTVVFDGQGRYAYERMLPVGLREHVVCDGATLLHLYPDLGLGGRRTVSRFHRLAFAQLVPWAVPPADDLARGADVRLVGERTVAVFPHGADEARDADGKTVPYTRLLLTFRAGDGRLAERRLVRMPALQTEDAGWETYAADGTVTARGADGKDRVVLKASAAEAGAPDLNADVKDLIMLPMPPRTVAQVRQTLKLDKRAYADLHFDEGLALLAACYGENNGDEAARVFQQCFRDRDQRGIGFFVLLAACGQNLDGEHIDVLTDRPQDPLAQYLALYSSPVLRKHASQWAVGGNQWGDGFLRRLAAGHALTQRWQNGKAVGGTEARQRAERDRALEYVRGNKGTALGFALLGLLEDRARDDEAHDKDAAPAYRALTDAWPLFEDLPGLAYAARYENARCLWKGGDRAEGRKRWLALYGQALADGELPAVDADFRQALLGEGGEADAWSDLPGRTAADLIRRQCRPAAFALAAQCWQLGDGPVSDRVLAAALDGIADAKEKDTLREAAVAFYEQTGRLAEADELLRELLAQPGREERAALWREAADLVERRDMPARELECLEKALDAEYRRPPEVIDLEAVRRDYGKLLDQYQRLADALEVLHAPAPADFTARVVRAADRWRALDGGAPRACELAGRILQRRGEADLSWDYLTTPVGLRPGDAEPWLGLAAELVRQGDSVLADRAYAAACDAEPTNAQYLWDRAQNLRRLGSREAYRVLQRLAEGSWQPRFQSIQRQAREQLKEP